MLFLLHCQILNFLELSMITLTVILPCNPSIVELEAFIVESTQTWISNSPKLKVNNDIREFLQLYSGPASLEYSVEELLDVESIMRFTPKSAITIDSGREAGADDMAVWFAKRIIARWGGFIDGHGDVIFENSWTREENK